MAGDEDVVGGCLGATGGDGADTGLCDELDGDARARVDLLEVVDELGEVLDRVNVVVRWRGDELHAGLGVAEACDEGVDLVAGKLPAFAGFRALRHLDFEFVGVDEVVGGDAEATGSDLFDVGPRGVAVCVGFVTSRVFSTFAGI